MKGNIKVNFNRLESDHKISAEFSYCHQIELDHKTQSLQYLFAYKMGFSFFSNDYE